MRPCTTEPVVLRLMMTLHVVDAEGSEMIVGEYIDLKAFFN